MDMTLIIAYT